jgi:ectoine hydroxylase-related dioxygenase (phytanoyl-CoA dioxygenase family)
VPLFARHPRSLRKITHLHDDELFFALATDPAVLDPMEAVLGPDIKLLRMDLFFKAPRVGWRICVHQDAVYWPVVPINTPDSSCTCFLFLDEATRDNGCLGFLPGRHTGGPIPARPTGGDTRGERHLDAGTYREADKVWVPCRAGGAVFFHGMAPHFSERNESPRIRRAVAISCVSARLRPTDYRRDIHGHEGRAPVLNYVQLRGRSFPGCV